MKIVEYKLHANPDRTMSTPAWIKGGGHFHNPDDHTMIAALADEEQVYYIPDTLTEYTTAELKARQLAIHAKYPCQKKDGDDPLTNDMVDMTDAEVETQVDEWVTDNS
jgi:hypothetical protein